MSCDVNLFIMGRTLALGKVISLKIISGNKFEKAFGVRLTDAPTIPKGYLITGTELSIINPIYMIGATIKGAKRG